MKQKEQKKNPKKQEISLDTKIDNRVADSRGKGNFEAVYFW